MIVPERLEAHRLIEEFMILANVAAAETWKRRGGRCIYRVHDAPTAEKIDALRESARQTLDMSFAKAASAEARRVQSSAAPADAPRRRRRSVNEVVLRCQAQAVIRRRATTAISA